MRCRAHRDPEVVEAKLSRLNEPHIEPLTAFVHRLREQQGGGESVPWFDPACAGINARMLVLLEAPGARAVGPGGPRPTAAGSGFISVENNDGTAENCCKAYKAAGLNYARDVVPWNIVPWYVGDGIRIRPVRVADLKEAEPALRELLDLLPNLRVVVLLGRKAQKGWARIEKDWPRIEPEGEQGFEGLPPCVAAPHPSPIVLNTRQEKRTEIINALREAKKIAEIPT